MAEGRPTPKSVFCLVESYALAFALSAAFFALLHLANSGVTVLALVNLALIGNLFGFLVWKLDSP